MIFSLMNSLARLDRAWKAAFCRQRPFICKFVVALQIPLETRPNFN